MEEMGTLSQNKSVGRNVTKWKSWVQCHKMEELGTVSQNGIVWHSVTKWQKWAHCHKMEEMGTLVVNKSSYWLKSAPDTAAPLLWW